MKKRISTSQKQVFKIKLKEFARSLSNHVAAEDNQWLIKGFVDLYKNIYTISADTKIVSKILEIHIFPKLLEFAKENGYKIVLAEHQNYYPDISFISNDDKAIKFALDIKTTYRLPENPNFCNGFTLGSHGGYFTNRNTAKNIQFPYDSYAGHFCLGIIYTRAESGSIDETRVYEFDKLKSITSVIKDFQIFVCEKWEIASDSQGSGNTANIGSIVKISDILAGNGVFKNLGEEWFDDYWINYGKITAVTRTGENKKITKLVDFLAFRGQSPDLANSMTRGSRNRKIKNG